jgi:xanthine/CO dehydrogenase XdhC/CoxF family maturation factor
VEPDGQAAVLAGGESGRAAGSRPEAEVEDAASAALRARRSRWQSLGARRVFVEVLEPPPRLLVCGAGDDARPLVALAASVGFRVLVADHRRGYLTAERFPEAQALLAVRADDEGVELPTGAETYAVVMTHSLQRDTAWILRLAPTDIPYVGLLGPRSRTARILADLGIAGGGRIFGPVGLDLGADGPEQVAVSVVAELLAARSGREPRHLREREVAVHAG